jgi:hypothetical protein
VVTDFDLHIDLRLSVSRETNGFELRQSDRRMNTTMLQAARRKGGAVSCFWPLARELRSAPFRNLTALKQFGYIVGNWFGSMAAGKFAS